MYRGYVYFCRPQKYNYDCVFTIKKKQVWWGNFIRKSIVSVILKILIESINSLLKKIEE